MNEFLEKMFHVCESNMYFHFYRYSKLKTKTNLCTIYINICWIERYNIIVHSFIGNVLFDFHSLKKKHSTQNSQSMKNGIVNYSFFFFSLKIYICISLVNWIDSICPIAKFASKWIEILRGNAPNWKCCRYICWVYRLDFDSFHQLNERGGP